MDHTGVEEAVDEAGTGDVLAGGDTGDEPTARGRQPEQLER